MNNELEIRKLIEQDYDIVRDWWKWWWKNDERMDKGILPDDGKGGLIIVKDKIPVACGFLYLTNSKTAFLGWIVSNPKYKEKDRKSLIGKLILNIEDFGKQLGYEYIMTSCGHKQLIRTHEKLGWVNTNKPSFELIKKI